MIRLKSLQQRYLIFILLPVAVLLFSIGFAGFTYTRKQLLAQWGESTILKLQRAAHHVDMRLSKPKEMLKVFHKSAGVPHAEIVENIILDQIKELEGVERVDLFWVEKDTSGSIAKTPENTMRPMGGNHEAMMKEGFMIMPFHRGYMADITPPYFDSSLGSKTVSLVSELKDQNDRTVGKLTVVIRFDDLVDAVESTGWWKENKAYLVDNAGNILTSNLDSPVKKLVETGSSLKRATLNAMIALPFGIVFSQGFPPEEVSGFYKLHEAPWTLVIVTPGAEILSRIVRFSVYYVVTGSVAILIILFMIRFVTRRAVFSIKAVSSAARKVAGGDYDVSLAVKTQDEVGELIRSFNTMVLQLEDRARLKDSLNLARVVQQNLLPEKAVRFESIDVAGQSIYCDETGGDYYDFLEFPEQGKGKFGVIVGDVSGHGISAALFMATVRALIRSRMIQSDDPSKIITDVNRLLCIDTAQSSNFMTLFFMMLDVAKNEVTWVRAGHDSAILYDTAADEFMELGGEGIALGVDEKRSFKEYSLNGLHNGQVILIGTDGIWETENERGERFGKDRLREILRHNSRGSAEKIIQAITDNLVAFRQNATQTDDVTMVVIKAWS